MTRTATLRKYWTDASMAKRSKETVTATDKAKVRVFFAEVEGNNESVQEALRTMVSAMSRPVRVISDQQTNDSVPPPLQYVDTQEDDESANHSEQTQGFEEHDTPTNNRKPRGSGRRYDRNAGLQLIPDLDFRPDGKESFKEFLSKKEPKNDIETALLAIYYMQNIMELDRIGPSHVMTAFKDATKPIPKDVRQTIRNAKNSKIWIDFSDIEELRTTSQGNNFVNYEMGNSE